jgi:hypothetical protein
VAGKISWYQQLDFQSLAMEFSGGKLKQKGFFHSAGNKLHGGLRPESTDQGEVTVGGEPLSKGVIQLLCAGTGRESRTISGPRAAAERDHEESAEPAAG